MPAKTDTRFPRKVAGNAGGTSGSLLRTSPHRPHVSVRKDTWAFVHLVT